LVPLLRQAVRCYWSLPPESLQRRPCFCIFYLNSLASFVCSLYFYYLFHEISNFVFYTFVLCGVATWQQLSSKMATVVTLLALNDQCDHKQLFYLHIDKNALNFKF